MSGIPSHYSGLYQNVQKMREVMPQAELLPRYFLITVIGPLAQVSYYTMSLIHRLGMTTFLIKPRTIHFLGRSTREAPCKLASSGRPGNTSKQTGRSLR